MRSQLGAGFNEGPEAAEQQRPVGLVISLTSGDRFYLGPANASEHRRYRSRDAGEDEFLRDAFYEHLQCRRSSTRAVPPLSVFVQLP